MVQSVLLKKLLFAAVVVSGVQQSQQQRAFGKVQERQSEIDADAEGDAARGRAIQRKKDLLRAISSQRAKAGAAGVAFTEGSPARIAQLDIDEATDDLFVDRANSLTRQRGLLSQGRAARKEGNVAATSTLLDTAVRAAELS